MAKYVFRWCIFLAVFCQGLTANAGELDDAKAFWDATLVCLGQINYAEYDSTADVMVAVNLAMRDWAIDAGVVGFDTVTIVAKTFFYTMNTNFMEKGLPHLPFRVIRISKAGDQVSGLRPVNTDQFGVLASGTSGEAPTTIAVGYSISGNRFWCFPAGRQGDKIYVEGPIEITAHAHGASSEAVIPESDRHAVVYRAASILAASHTRPELASRLEILYQNAVAKRQGDYRTQIPQVPQ